MKAIWA